jgi:hypothetical protein
MKSIEEKIKEIANSPAFAGYGTSLKIGMMPAQP